MDTDTLLRSTYLPLLYPSGAGAVRSHPDAKLSHWDLYNFPKEMNRQEVRVDIVHS